MEPFLGLFEPDRKAGGFVVTFPDFGYGATQGETDEEAMEMAQDLLMLTISDYIRASKPLPTAKRHRGSKFRPVPLPALQAAICLSGCFSRPQLVVGGLGKIPCAPYLLIMRGLTPSPESKQRLEGSHGQPATVVAKNEFIEINLKLLATHAMIGSDQPLLQISNRAVCQGHDRLRTFAEVNAQRLATRHMLEARVLQPGKAFEAVRVHLRARCHVSFQEVDQGGALEIPDDFHASATGAAASLLHGHQDERGLAALELAASAQARLGPANPRIINFHFALQRFACQIDHGAPEFMQHHPRGFVAAERQLAV